MITMLFKISIGLCVISLIHAKLPDLTDLGVSKKRSVFTINFCIVSVWIGFRLFSQSHNFFSFSYLINLFFDHHYVTVIHYLLSSYLFAYLISLPVLTVLVLGLIILKRNELKGKKHE